MKSYRNILAAIDLSGEAQQVLSKAASLAAANEAELSVVHVAQALTLYGDFPYYASPIDTELYQQNDIRTILYDIVDKRLEAFDIPKGAVEIRFGYAAEEIVSKAKDDGVDLIVIGSHGRHGIRLLLGSTANAVLHRAGCDVLAVRIRED